MNDREITRRSIWRDVSIANPLATIELGLILQQAMPRPIARWVAALLRDFRWHICLTLYFANLQDQNFFKL